MNIINMFLRSSTVYGGVIEDFLGYGDFCHIDWQMVRLRLDDGRVIRAALEDITESPDNPPFEVGDRVSGSLTGVRMLRPDDPKAEHGSAKNPVVLVNVEHMKPNENPVISQWINRPLRRTFENLALGGHLADRTDLFVSRPHKAKQAYFGRLAHRFGSRDYDENGFSKSLPNIDPEKSPDFYT